MSLPFYPTLNDGLALACKAAVGQMMQQEGYLDHPSCPYGPEVKAFLKQIAGQVETPVEASQDLSIDDKLDVLENDLRRVLRDLDAFGRTLTNADHSEKLQYFKTKTSLTEKLISLIERVLSLREMSQFQVTVIQFLDEICSKDQQTELKNRLKGLTS